VDLIEIGFKVVDQTQLALDRAQWWAFMTMLVSFLVL